MLSESQGVRAHRAPKTAYPMLEGFRTVRMKFSKVGSMQYISHLDLQRNFARVLIRAGIPVWYTKGFNPHAKIVFGLPLSVGAQSVCEYVDVRIERDMPCEEERRDDRGDAAERGVSARWLRGFCCNFLGGV